MVVKGDNIVGHLPKIISTPSLLFLRSGGRITCTVTGRRRYSADLEWKFYVLVVLVSEIRSED